MFRFNHRAVKIIPRIIARNVLDMPILNVQQLRKGYMVEAVEAPSFPVEGFVLLWQKMCLLNY
jgi:hypothetical protein